MNIKVPNACARAIALSATGLTARQIGERLGLTMEYVWFLLSMDKTRARRAVETAVRRGDLTRPDVCEKCGLAPGKIHAHHTDYSQPLLVEWLCGPCHMNEHRPVEAVARRLEIQRLLASGTSQRAVAQAMGISRVRVRDIVGGKRRTAKAA